MSSETLPPFNINKFLKNLRDSDTDFTIIAFNDLIDYLNKVKEFELPQEIIQNDFLPSVINRLSDKTPAIVNPIFRIIVLLAGKLPIASLSVFFDHIFNFVNDSECQVRNQILSVLREILSHSTSFPLEKQQIIVKFFISKLNESANVEILVFNIDLLATLLERLGDLFNESNLNHAKELIIAHFEDSRLDILPSIASLTKIWMTVAVNKLPDEFYKMIQELYKLGENNPNAFTILSSMVCYRPSIYQKEAVKLIELFSDRIKMEEEELSQKLNEDQETDIYYDTPYVSHMVDYLSSLTSLVKTFHDECTDEMVDNFMKMLFLSSYLTYGLSQSNDDDNQDNGNDEEDEDDGFEVEPGEDGEEVDLDDVDDEIVTGDDSWKIRKAAMTFATVLIQFFTAKFYDTLGYRDENNDCLGVVNTLIKDGDSGAQKDAFDFLQVVIHYYKDYLQPEDVDQWFLTLNSQLSAKNSQSIASIVIDTITYVLNEYKSIPYDLLVKIIGSIRPLLNNNTIQPSLVFILTIFNVANPPTSDVVSAVAVVLTDIINNTNISSTVPYLSTTSKLFVYARSIDNDGDQECIDNLRNLVSSIISLCTYSEEPTEKSIQAFEVLGVFLASFDNDIVGLDKDSLDIIVQTFEKDQTMKTMKPICGSICLIAASPNGIEKLTSYADRILHRLCDILKQNTKDIDNSYLFRYLWTLRMLLEKNIVSPESNECEEIAPYLAIIFSTPDPRNILLSISIFILIPNTILQSLNSIQYALQDKNFEDHIINGFAQLISLGAEHDISQVEKALISLVESEYAKGARQESNEITQNIAYVIGFVSGQYQDIREKLLHDFEQKIVNPTNLATLPFALKCVGEIGALIDLSDKTQLIDSVFQLIGHSNREVFNAAAECIGLLATGSMNTILPRVLKQALLVNDNSVWILATLSMTKRLSLIDPNKLHFVGDEFNTISSFLIQNADYSKPTEKSIAESFSYMIKINPNEYIKQLLEIAQTKPEAGPVASHGIAIYFEETANSPNPYYCFNFINDIMNSFNADNPRVSEYIILCLKICLRIQKRHYNQENDTSNLEITTNSEDIPDVNLFEYKEIIFEATKYDEQKQVITIDLGLNQKEAVDIGINLRLNAINCLILILQMDKEFFNTEELFNLVLWVIKNDPSEEVKSLSISLLTDIILDKDKAFELFEIISRESTEFNEIEKIIFTSKTKVDFLEESFFRLLVAIKILTENRKINEIEKIYARHKDDGRIKKLESDLSYSITESSPLTAILTAGSASVSLMKSFYPEASIIYLI
ncbi:Cullin-associated NEDD8-dissociated protein 1 [Tritrichomonas musculus]|uniref:Cullin-associated NEDD8-dissociated protein 1 n=1 Tax=Tritrichomonas musculus TaxID=1915356 RepID=A0ABR2GY00_9EUKA